MENPTLTTLVNTFCRRIEELEKLADSYRKEAIDLQKGYESVCRICDEWRNDYQDLNKKHLELQLQYNELKEDYDRVSANYDCAFEKLSKLEEENREAND